MTSAVSLSSHLYTSTQSGIATGPVYDPPQGICTSGRCSSGDGTFPQYTRIFPSPTFARGSSELHADSRLGAGASSISITPRRHLPMLFDTENSSVWPKRSQTDQSYVSMAAWKVCGQPANGIPH